MRPTTTIFVVIFAALSFTAAAPSSADSGDAPIASLAVMPAKIELDRFGAAPFDVAVVAHVTGVGRLPADLELSFSASPGLDVRIGKPLSKLGDIVWPVRIAVNGDAADAGAVDFRLAYPAASGAEKPLVQRASLDVQVEPARHASPVDDADVSIKIDAADISEDVPIRSYLVVKNKSNQAFTVAALGIAGPKFLNMRYDMKSAVVAGHGALRVPLDISVAAPERAQIGEWLILANVTLTRGEGNHRETGVAVAEQKVKVGVPGVSDVLKVLDLPSLLLVPGALILATWSLLLGAIGAGKYTWLEWKSVSFWLVAITLSIAAFAVQNFFGFGPNFLVAYGISDVAWLWFGSVGFGVASFALGLAAHWSWRRFRDWRAKISRQAHEPLAADEPIDTLRKLLEKNLPLYMPSYARLPPPDGREQAIFKTGFAESDGKAWIIPKMLYAQAPGGSDATQLMIAIGNANDQADSRPAALVELLAEGLSGGSITLTWENGAIGSPTQMPADGFAVGVPPASPLEWAG